MKYDPKQQTKFLPLARQQTLIPDSDPGPGTSITERKPGSPRTGRWYLHSMVLFMGCVLLALGGCSTTKTASPGSPANATAAVQAKAPDGKVRKKVGLALFENKTTFGSDQLSLDLRQQISETMIPDCDDTLIVELPQVASGGIDNMALAELGRKLGLSAVITGAVIDISAGQEERGLLWFRDMETYIQTLLIVSAYDCETGAKLFDESLREEIEVKAFNPRELNFQMPAVQKALAETAERMGEGICEALNEKEWRGYIQAKKGSRVILSSGSDAGLQAGMVLEVLDNSEVIEGMNGQRFFIPGPPSAQIRLIGVTPESAEAEILTGTVELPGNSVRIID